MDELQDEPLPEGNMIENQSLEQEITIEKQQPKQKQTRTSKEVVFQSDLNWLKEAIKSGKNYWDKDTVPGVPKSEWERRFKRLWEHWGDWQKLSSIFAVQLPLLERVEGKYAFRIRVRPFVRSLTEERLFRNGVNELCAEETLAQNAMQEMLGAEPLIPRRARLFIGVGTMCYFLAQQLLQERVDGNPTLHSTIITPSLEVASLLNQQPTEHFLNLDSRKIELSGTVLNFQRGSVMAQWNLPPPHDLEVDKDKTVVMGFQSISMDGTIHTKHGQTLWLTERALKKASSVIIVGRYERLHPNLVIDPGEEVTETFESLIKSIPTYLLTDGEPPDGFNRSRFTEVRVLVSR